ncbi:MAG: hypothetical protein HYU69_00320 [Bacteroidetes bacterium]|nr:hypothetical protein [Bacteroidota bacterium]
MNSLVHNIIPSIRILKLISNSQDYEFWLKKEYRKPVDAKIFQGYKFFIECAFSQLFDHVAGEDFFKAQEDFLLQCASGQSKFIEKLPNTCERIIFLKNIYNSFKPVLKSKNLSELNSNLQSFLNEMEVFEKIFDGYFKFSRRKNITRGNAIGFLLMENLYIQFTQVNNNGPVAYHGTLLKNYWIDDNRLEFCLYGYKYALQYIWHKIVGEKVYRKTSLRLMHRALSWRKYVYLKQPKGLSHMEQILNQRFDLKRQTSLDSYFYRIKHEIITPTERKYDFDILSAENFFKTNDKRFQKKIFKKLLSSKGMADPYSTLSMEEKIEMLLYWHPLLVFEEGAAMHNGIPAFITLLAGTIALRKNTRTFRKVIVCKFVHPLDEKRNDYSYGILIDSKAAAGHYYNGWLLYYDCCGDHSGFSGSEQKRAEEIIQKYKRNGRLQLREMSVDKGLFKKYVAKHMYSPDQEALTAQKVREVEERLEQESRKRKLLDDDILGKAKAIILEQLAFYIHSKNYHDKYSVDLNINKSSGEIDVILHSNSEVRIIECKVTPDNNNLKIERKKLIKKLKVYKQRKKQYEFWFWHQPSKENTNWLKKNKVRFTIVKNGSRDNPILKGVDLDNIKHVMDYLV